MRGQVGVLAPAGCPCLTGSSVSVSRIALMNRWWPTFLTGVLAVLLLPVGAAASVTEYRTPTPVSRPLGITAGPDGALWFTEKDAGKIGRVTTGGSFSEFDLPTPDGGPQEITAGPDGALWFTEKDAGKIGRVTTTGSVTEYPVPT